MRLLIGGAAQGKLTRAVALTGAGESEILHGESCALTGAQGAKVLAGTQDLVRRCMEAGQNPLALLEELVERNPDIIITAREVGCGIVPLERTQREWRELTGRVCCALAARAEHVERLMCGICIPIK